LRRLYTFLFYLALPLIITRLLWRARRAPAYLKRWPERFSYISPPDLKQPIWVHAVSVGEVIAAIPLIKALQKQHPERSIVVTTMTPTGSERVRAALGDSVFHVYAPYDIPSAIKRFLQKIKPSCLIIMETELWPNMLSVCAEHHIPICVANARLSERSARKYHYLGAWMKKILSAITLLIAQTQADAERFIALGMEPSRIRVTGSIKFDIQISDDLQTKAQQLREQWDKTRPVWIAASTHPGEDEIILETFAALRKSLPRILLVLVPRHADRFSTVAALCRKQDYVTALRSETNATTNLTEADIFLGDTIGELLLFYAAADVAFVGGSFTQTGGHNLLEPAALSIPACTGPNMFNFVEITHLLQTAGGVFIVNDATQLSDRVLQLLQDPALREHAGKQNLSVVAANRGALAKHLDLLNPLISSFPH
jgi:3-deoxy-D-manno-octulosonic-acid transferase